MVLSRSGSIFSDFTRQVQYFDREKYTIVAWDPPGSGYSRPPDKDVSQRMYYRDAECAISFMKVTRFLVVVVVVVFVFALNNVLFFLCIGAANRKIHVIGLLRRRHDSAHHGVQRHGSRGKNRGLGRSILLHRRRHKVLRKTARHRPVAEGHTAEKRRHVRQRVLDEDLDRSVGHVQIYVRYEQFRHLSGSAAVDQRAHYDFARHPRPADFQGTARVHARKHQNRVTVSICKSFGNISTRGAESINQWLGRGAVPPVLNGEWVS